MQNHENPSDDVYPRGLELSLYILTEKRKPTLLKGNYFYTTDEASIGVSGISDICLFTSRDMEYLTFNFQGFRIFETYFGNFRDI